MESTGDDICRSIFKKMNFKIIEMLNDEKCSFVWNEYEEWIAIVVIEMIKWLNNHLPLFIDWPPYSILKLTKRSVHKKRKDNEYDLFLDKSSLEKEKRTQCHQSLIFNNNRRKLHRRIITMENQHHHINNRSIQCQQEWQQQWIQQMLIQLLKQFLSWKKNNEIWAKEKFVLILKQFFIIFSFQEKLESYEQEAKSGKELNKDQKVLEHQPMNFIINTFLFRSGSFGQIWRSSRTNRMYQRYLWTTEKDTNRCRKMNLFFLRRKRKPILF